MTTVKKETRNQKYERNLKEQGLEKMTFWVPSICAEETKELMTVIKEFYLEKGQFHRKLFPAMYREFSTGKMGNKSLHEIKKLSEVVV